MNALLERALHVIDLGLHGGKELLLEEHRLLDALHIDAQRGIAALKRGHAGFRLLSRVGEGAVLALQGIELIQEVVMLCTQGIVCLLHTVECGQRGL